MLAGWLVTDVIFIVVWRRDRDRCLEHTLGLLVRDDGVRKKLAGCAKKAPANTTALRVAQSSAPGEEGGQEQSGGELSDWDEFDSSVEEAD